MANLTLKDKTVDKYFNYLKKLDHKSKKKLIVRLVETLDVKSSKTGRVSSLFGAWKDHRSSDNIIMEIKESRVEATDPEKFE